MGRENQKLADLGRIVETVRSHTKTTQDLFVIAGMAPEAHELAQALSRLPERLEVSVEDLRTVGVQLDKIRTLASEKGYSDVLKVLDEKLPYDRGY
jgi:hypothetical protein